MSELLSTSGNRLLGLCDEASSAVASSIRDMIGTASGGQMVNMGADGTPTKVIDRAAEDAVLDVLQSSGMGFLVLSEERGEVRIGENPDHFLHLDPLDGTFNAISGIPFYALSIYISGDDCRLGYIYDLARGQRFYAEAGRGAYAGSGERICVSRNEDFKNFSISAYTIRPNTGRITGIGNRVRRIRTLGSASLEMALVARGMLDAFVDLRGMMRVVDVAAGILIIEEAGGRVSDSDGNQLHMAGDMWQKRCLVGSNGRRHEDLLKLIDGGCD